MSKALLVRTPEADEEHVTGNWREGGPCYTVVESQAELCPTVTWKAELLSDGLEYLAEDVFKC